MIDIDLNINTDLATKLAIDLSDDEVIRAVEFMVERIAQ